MISNDIQKEVMELKTDEKIYLVELILNSIDAENGEIEKAWIEESEIRYNDYISGKTKAYPLEDVLQRMKNEF